MVSLRSGKGLGDTLYLQSIARHLVLRGGDVEVCTNYPDVFRPLAGRIKVSPFRRERVDLVAHYTSRKTVKGTDQFLDCCSNAGMKEPVDLKLDWAPVNTGLIDRLRRVGRPVVVVQLPRWPMGRADGYGRELLPDCGAIQKAIDLLRACGAYIVQIGQGEALFEFTGIDFDLSNRTSVADVIDVVSASAGVLGYCSFIVPLAESLAKPALLIWSRAGLKSTTDFIRLITPEKIFHRPSSRAVMDDSSPDELVGAVNAFCEQIGVPVAV